MYANFLNTAEGFWETYGMIPGSVRRSALLGFFMKHPEAKLPCNNKYMASTKDLDLEKLIKRGVLKQIRGEGFSRFNPLKRKSSSKRITYLILVKGNCES